MRFVRLLRLLRVVLLSIGLFAVGGCVGSCTGRHSLHSRSGLTLTPGTYVTTWARDWIHCAARSLQRPAAGFGVRNSAGGGVDCLICDTEELETESAGTGEDIVRIYTYTFKQVTVGDVFPAPRSLFGNGTRDTGTPGSMVVIANPFPSAGRVVMTRIMALETTGTLLFAIFRQTSGTAGSCGVFQRLREVEITRTCEGIDERAYGGNELSFASGEYYGLVWSGAGGGIVPFSDEGDACCYERTDAVAVETKATVFARNYHLNVYIKFE